MYKKKIFGYVEDERMSWIEDMKERLKQRDHLKASKSMIIELALMELEKNNDILTIEKKLLRNEML